MFKRMVALVVAVVILGPGMARAQEIDEDYIEFHLGPASLTLQGMGEDQGDQMIADAQAWGVSQAFGIPLWKARRVVRGAREDRDYGKIGANQYPAKLFLASFMRIDGMSCDEAKQKADAAQELANTLSAVSSMYVAGGGIIGGFVARARVVAFAGPMAIAATTTAMASGWASRLAASYRSAACWVSDKGGNRWSVPSKIDAALRLSPISPAPSAPGSSGWRLDRKSVV